MSQQMNMSGMGAVAGMSGPGAPVGQPMSTIGTPGSAPNQKDIRTKFHTFIYDYFLKTNRFDLARGILTQMDVETASQPKSSPKRKDTNGVNDDSDSKEDVKRPDDLPPALVPAPTDSPFIWDWFCQFWDLYEAQRSKGTPASRTYLMGSQNRMMNERRMRAEPNIQANMAGMRNGMMQNMPPDVARKMMLQGRANPAQLQQMQQQSALRQQMMQQNHQMQREGSAMDINGQQRTQSPAPGENAPSPKRQRLEGAFNGAPIGPSGRAQGQGVSGQQQVEYSQGLRQQITNNMNSNMNKGISGNAPVMAQGSPAMDTSNGEFLNGTQIRPGAAAAAAAAQGAGNNGATNSNHALQDYQMQLMLLEQQNKKRLLMARQEQDNMTNGPGGPIPPGQPGAFAPAISPSGSRAGLSPSSGEQLKPTPKMSQGVVPSPTPDGPMMQGRASPAPGFDPSQMNPNMPPNMFPQMNKMGMVGPNGQMMQPPSSHPGMAAPMTPQQMEIFARAQAANGGRVPNGFMPQAPPPMMPGQQPGAPMQQPPNLTPHQRNAAMPPPPAPTGDVGRGTQPSSPQQPPAPPTPSQGKNAKGKKDNKSNKAPAKKGNTGATPVSEADQPPTPTPAPPITPTSTQPFPPKNGQPQNQAAQQPPSQNPLSQNQPDLGGGPFGNLDGGDFSGMNLDFGNLEGPDVLDNFDFDSFLNNEAGDAGFGFDASMNFDTGLEAGGDVV